MDKMDNTDDKQALERHLIDLASDNQEIQKAAESWFVQQGPDITSSLARGLDDDDLGSVCHWRILRLLQHFAKQETLPAILKAFRRALERKDPIVLPGAMDALAVFRVPTATNALIAALEEPNLDLVKHAAALVGQTGDLNAVEPLFRLLDGDNPSVRYSAARGLIQLHDPSVRAALEKHLERETNLEVRELITSGLAEGSSKWVQ